MIRSYPDVGSLEDFPQKSVIATLDMVQPTGHLCHLSLDDGAGESGLSL